MGKYARICEMCGEEFNDYCKTTRFCSRTCYDKHRKENGKLKEVICPICNNKFRQTYLKQIFCSVECRVMSTKQKIECVCEYCKKVFYRKRSEVNKNKHHYCSKQCHYNAISWNETDTLLLKNNFKEKSYKEIFLLLDGRKSIEDIKRKSYSLGLTRSNFWSDEEIEVLKNNYSFSPYQIVMSLLPNRSRSSINGKAKSLGLKSYYYLNRRYTIAEENYLKNNYLNASNEELARTLQRSVGGIAQHLCILKLYRPVDKKGYSDIAEYIRSRLIFWAKQIKKINYFKCAITGAKSNIIVHHIRGFNLLLNEAIEQINFPIYDDINNYSEIQLDQLFDAFYNLQEKYKSYICITEKIHKHFHSIYGYGNNTEEQWDDFIQKYYK